MESEIISQIPSFPSLMKHLALIASAKTQAKLELEILGIYLSSSSVITSFCCSACYLIDFL
jgi:hypothetical protein